MKKLTRWALCLGLVLALTVCCALADESPAVKVQLDGQDLAFTDAVPQVKSQRTFLPFRAVFEAMGAEVGWEGNIITAVRGDKSLTMTLDQPTATLTQNGKTTTITMDVAPYVDPSTWRTYVPVRFAAQAFGCAVGWDGPNATAIIVDIEKLVDTALTGKSFTYLEQVAALDGKYDTGIWDMTASFDADISVMSMPMSMTGTVKGTVQDSEKMSMNMNMKLDMASVVQAVSAMSGSTPDAEGQAMLNALKAKGVDLSMRGDLAQGKLYMNMDLSALGAAASGLNMDAGTWYLMDMAAMLNGSGLDWSKMLTEAKDMDVLTMIQTMLSQLEPDDATTAYTEIKTTVDAVANAFCDQGFVLEDGQRVATYAVAEDDADLTLVLVLNMDGEKVTSYAMGMDLAAVADDGQSMGMSFTTGISDQNDMQAQITLEVGIDTTTLMTLDMSMEGTYAPGTTAPVTTPPADATVVDYMELLEAQMGSDLDAIGGQDGPTAIFVTAA